MPSSIAMRTMPGVADHAPTASPTFPTDWRWHHAHAATSLADIEALFPARFDLTHLDRPAIERAAALYGMRATPYYLSLARAADVRDPVWAWPSPTRAS